MLLELWRSAGYGRAMPRPRKAGYGPNDALQNQDFGGDRSLQELAARKRFMTKGEVAEIVGCSRNRVLEHLELQAYCLAGGRPRYSPYLVAKAIYETRRRMDPPQSQR